MSDPKPWLFDPDAPEGVRALLEGASADGPSAAQLERLAARVGPAVGVAATALVVQAGMPPIAPLDPGAFAAGKVALAGAGKLSAAAWLKAAIAAGMIGVAGYGAVQLMPRADHGVRDRAVAPTEVVPVPATPHAVVPPVATQEPTPQAVEAAPAPVEPSVRESSVSEAQPPSEIALMQAAQDAHATPARVLALVQKHARLYPDGMFAQEREVLAISALLTLGRRTEAETRAKRMATTYPGSAHLRRVRVLLDGADTR